MTSPTKEQTDQIHERNHQIGIEEVRQEVEQEITEKHAGAFQYQEDLNEQLAEALRAAREENTRLQGRLGISPTDSIPVNSAVQPSVSDHYTEEEYYYYD